MQEKIDMFIAEWNVTTDDEQKLKMFYKLGATENRELIVSLYMTNKEFVKDLCRLIKQRNDARPVYDHPKPIELGDFNQDDRNKR